MNVSYDNTEYDTSSIYEMGESCVRFRTVAKTSLSCKNGSERTRRTYRLRAITEKNVFSFS